MWTGEYKTKLYRMFNEREQQVFELNLMIIENDRKQGFPQRTGPTWQHSYIWERKTIKSQTKTQLQTENHIKVIHNRDKISKAFESRSILCTKNSSQLASP